MYKAARDVHTNGIHNTFTSKGRGKMNHIKQFFREKGPVSYTHLTLPTIA